MSHVHENPIAAPCVMVIFGATGDLTKRKLIPALCNLAAETLRVLRDVRKPPALPKKVTCTAARRARDTS